MTFITGCILIVVCVGFPQFIPQVQHSEKHLGASIDSGLISVRQVKEILDHLGMKVGPIDNNWTREYARAVADFQFSQHIEADGWSRDLCQVASGLARILLGRCQEIVLAGTDSLLCRTSCFVTPPSWPSPQSRPAWPSARARRPSAPPAGPTQSGTRACGRAAPWCDRVRPARTR